MIDAFPVVQVVLIASDLVVALKPSCNSNEGSIVLNPTFDIDDLMCLRSLLDKLLQVLDFVPLDVFVNVKVLPEVFSEGCSTASAIAL